MRHVRCFILILLKETCFPCHEHLILASLSKRDDFERTRPRKFTGIFSSSGPNLGNHMISVSQPWPKDRLPGTRKVTAKWAEVKRIISVSRFLWSFWYFLLSSSSQEANTCLLTNQPLAQALVVWDDLGSHSLHDREDQLSLYHSKKGIEVLSEMDTPTTNETDRNWNPQVG